ncbi:MAG: tetratricopeptide repeat protein, partial [Pelodictyon phaeoclathratiforme]
MSLRVLSIEIDGKSAESVSGVSMTAPAEEMARKSTLKKGQGIASGTEIIAPPRSVLVLESANGEEIRLQPGCGYRSGSVSDRGETHTLLFGKAFFKVKNPLNFFNVNYDSFVANVRGTEFSVAVEPKKEICFTLNKGKLLVQRDVKVKILEENKEATLTASEVLEQGKKIEVSYQLGIDEYLKEFKTFRDAEEYYRQKLQEDEQSGDYDRLQRGLNGMGNILVTLGKGKDAIVHYEKSLSLNLKLYPEGVHPDIAKSYIGLGNACVGLGEYLKAIEYYEKSLSLNLKLYPEGVHPDIAMSYNNLGVACDGYGEHSKAIEYYKKSLSLNLKLYLDGVHPDIAKSYIGLGNACVGLGEYLKAIEYYEKSLSLNLKLYPEGV